MRRPSTSVQRIDGIDVTIDSVNDRADYTRLLESCVNAFGRSVVPVQLPIGSEKNLTGVIDIIKMKAFTYTMGGDGKGKEGEIPANMAEAAKIAHERFVTSAVKTR